MAAVGGVVERGETFFVFRVDVGPFIQQDVHHATVPRTTRQVERGPTLGVSPVAVGSSAQEVPCDVNVILADCEVQGGAPRLIHTVDGGIVVEKEPHNLPVASAHCCVEGSRLRQGLGEGSECHWETVHKVFSRPTTPEGATRVRVRVEVSEG